MAAVLLAGGLSACGGDEAARQRVGDAADSEQVLPTPSAAGGVTGAASVGAGGSAPTLGTSPGVVSAAEDAGPALGPDGLPLPGDPALATTADPAMVDPAAINPETGLAPDPDGAGPLAAPQAPDAGAAEPTSADAVGVVRDYYAAINARNFGRAYALWSGGGRASGQTPEQFAGGYAQTQGVSVEIGAPGAQDAGAGQRYIQVPIAVRASQADGSLRRYAGSLTLHRAVVDGATADQRAWRIRNADLREVTP